MSLELEKFCSNLYHLFKYRNTKVERKTYQLNRRRFGEPTKFIRVRGVICSFPLQSNIEIDVVKSVFSFIFVHIHKYSLAERLEYVLEYG